MKKIEKWKYLYYFFTILSVLNSGILIYYFLVKETRIFLFIIGTIVLVIPFIFASINIMVFVANKKKSLKS